MCQRIKSSVPVNCDVVVSVLLSHYVRTHREHWLLCSRISKMSMVFEEVIISMVSMVFIVSIVSIVSIVGRLALSYKLEGKQRMINIWGKN